MWCTLLHLSLGSGAQWVFLDNEALSLVPRLYIDSLDHIIGINSFVFMLEKSKAGEDIGLIDR